ncbi:hypothetical protein FQA39_LY11581 [Lamprigera yunnana]|nr:hypothetical protein FQA39_LY11581 [Lamprigera yunnana]
MKNLLSIMRLLITLVTVNFISIAILVILKFNEWDVAATVVTCAFSIFIIGLELLQKHQCTLQPWFRFLLMVSIVSGGVSGFFWFFHLIHKLGHYQGDLEDTLWTSVTIILTFFVSAYLVMASYKTSKYQQVQSQDVEEEVAVPPVSIIGWARQYFDRRQSKVQAELQDKVIPV